MQEPCSNSIIHVCEADCGPVYVDIQSERCSFKVSGESKAAVSI